MCAGEAAGQASVRSGRRAISGRRRPGSPPPAPRDLAQDVDVVAPHLPDVVKERRRLERPDAVVRQAIARPMRPAPSAILM